MHLLQAIVLGIVQGITEFLPISSSGHLRLVPALLGWGDAGPAFTAVTQLGTITAVFVYFWHDLVRVAKSLLGAMKTKELNADSRLGWAILAGTLPAGILGLILKKFIEHEARDLRLIAGALIVMGIVLYVTEVTGKKKRELKEISILDGVLIGAAQALALIPGNSRSGSTLSAGFLLGYTREAATRFSFLLSVPIITLSGLYEFKDVIKPPKHLPGDPPILEFSKLDTAVATVVAGVVGYFCIAWLLKFLRTNSTLGFMLYRLALGALLFGMIFAGKLSPH